MQPIATPLVVPDLTEPLPSADDGLSENGMEDTAITGVPMVDIASPAKMLATTIFFFPVVFFAISDTTT